MRYAFFIICVLASLTSVARPDSLTKAPSLLHFELSGKFGGGISNPISCTSREQQGNKQADFIGIRQGQWVNAAIQTTLAGKRRFAISLDCGYSVSIMPINMGIPVADRQEQNMLQLILI